MEKQTVLDILNKVQYSIREKYFDKLKKEEIVSYEYFIKIRKDFITESLETYINFERNYSENIKKTEVEKFKKIRFFIESEIKKLAYDIEWKKYYH